MEYNTITLSNGLRVIHLPSDSPVVFCGYDIAAGTRHEQKGEEGLAHFCEHVTFKGTRRRSSVQIINALERLGGELNAFTNKEETVFYAAVTREHIAKAVDILSDMVFRSIYPEAELKKETEVICDEIESYNDSPSELIYDEFENMVFSGHPLGHGILGEAERLRTYNTETALAFVNRMYTPDKMVFFAYGNVDFKKLVRLLKKETSETCRIAPGSLAHRLSADARTTYHPQRTIKNKDCHQAHVLVGNIAYGLHDERRMPLYLLNNILGGPGMNSRLNLALREKRGLVYTVESSVISYSDTGLWSIYFGCDPHDIDRCIKIVRRELDKFMQKPLTCTQLHNAKRQILGQLTIAGDNRENFALDLAKTYLHFNKGKDMNELTAKIHAISMSDIQNTAQRIFADDMLSVLIYK
ncbi:MAG: insulinase family protein [Prevotella sp.]|nr:insulinase family protein [Prevotella sp.]